MNRRLKRDGIRTLFVIAMLLCAFRWEWLRNQETSSLRNSIKTSNAPFLKPDEAVSRRCRSPNGFDVSIFASEPDIAEPIAFLF